MWRITDPQGNESAKVKYEIVEYTRGKGLDLGCGPFKAFPHFIGVDNGHHAREFGWQMRPDVHVDTVEDLGLFASESMDFVFSSHTLEHLPDPGAALKEWARVVRPGGHLVLYVPDEDQYPKVGEPGANPDHKWNVNYDRVVQFMDAVERDWDLVRFEKRDADYGPGATGNEYSLLFVFKVLGRAENPSRALSYCNPKPEKRAAVVRYGGFGDSIQASSVLPGLKEQGYHITFYTTPRGQDILKHDPHIDAFYIQDTEQVPNNELSAFWEVQQKHYDKWVNLCESVEATLLALPDRTNHRWPHAVRHKQMNQNYLEFTHELADVPMPPKPKFYMSEDEKTWAQKFKQETGPVILWVLSGSSVHKSTPYVDQVLARLMLETDYKVVLVGDKHCQILEAGWEQEPRIIRRSGVWSIRETLAFAHYADLVVGPETGVLNAVSHTDVPKVVMLSHSSVENLTRDWKATIALTPNSTPCYPCHQLHYGWEHCHQQRVKIPVPKCEDAPDGFVIAEPAKCVANITPDMIEAAILQALIFRKAA